MDDGQGSKRKKKKKRGKSLIFKNLFKHPNSGDDHSSGTGGKILASDDNLVYCDVSGNCVDPDFKKPPSSHRMSRIFKAVLFDTAVKKKIDGNESETNESMSSSPVKDDRIKKIEKIEKVDNSINEHKSNVVKDSEVDHSSTDRSNQSSLPSKATESPVSSSSSTPNTTGSQTLTERKVNSVEKKPPLPSNPRSPAKSIPAEDKKPVVVNNPAARLRLFIVLGLFVLVVLWKSYAAMTAESSDRDSGQYTNTAIAGEEL
ncbi:hypothetical protein L2E82_37643 [Cichorium intybus]|uniref:Uncharacterized protein n=1 Tax=Cichorium intybus TaxID=13427 RepID=A0ACB9AFH2_CICIN|nr:hypothetical protein L2E82_37643 [Cichorium intybus]